MSGTIGGEFTLRKNFAYPIATYMESKRDASRALLNALSAATREDGIGIQILIRPANERWAKSAVSVSEKIIEDKDKKKTGLSVFFSPSEIMESLWKPPESDDKKPEDKKPLNSVEQATVDAIQEKTRYPGYEVLIRTVVSSNTAARSQVILKNIVAAFALFDSPTFNGFKFTLAKNIEELTSSYIFRFFPQQVNKNILNSVELATIFHLPDQNSIPSSQVKRQMSKQVDGPTQVMETGLLLGYNEFRGVKKPIRLSDKDRRRHIHIIGQTGVGKSVLQENLAYQDMLDGRGFALVDPHGDLAEHLLEKVPKERVEDIIYFNPSDMDNPIGLNMFEFDHPDQKDFLVQEAIGMLYGLYDPGHTGIVGPRLEHIFRNCALLLMSDPAGGTFVDIPKLLVDDSFRNNKLKYVTDQQVLDFWTKEFPASQRSSEAGEVISWVIAKFGPFISNDAMRNIIGQTKSGFDFQDIMNNNKILLVNLSKGKLGDLNSKLLGIVFVMKFQAAAMARAKIPEDERKDFTLYVDEFQNFATDSFETILSEARKYRLSLVLANQFMTQLKEELREAILGNVGTTITGRIGITDAEIMVKRYTPVFDAEDLTKLPNFESVCVAQIEGVPSAPFSMAWIPPMGHQNAQLGDALRRLSAAKYGHPRAQVEREIAARTSMNQSSGNNKQLKNTAGAAANTPNKIAPSSSSSFLDEWLAKRKQVTGRNSTTPRPVSSPLPANTKPPMSSTGNVAAAGPAQSQNYTDAYSRASSSTLPAQPQQQQLPQQPSRNNPIDLAQSQLGAVPPAVTVPPQVGESPNANSAMQSANLPTEPIADNGPISTPQQPASNTLNMRDSDNSGEVSIKLR